MKQILLIINLFFVFLTYGQVEQKNKEERVAPATNNNVIRETEELDNSRDLKKSRTRRINQEKVSQLASVSSNLAATIQQANRMSDRKSYTDEQKEKLSEGVRQIEKIDNNSFEYHLYKYLERPYNFENIESLKLAEKLNAYDFTVLTSFTAFHKINGNEAELKTYLSKLYQGKYFNDDLLNYASLTLKSLPKNSVLITNGKNDTYPLLIQQKIKNIRNDVEIISLDHLLSKEYRKKLEMKGYSMPQRSTVDVGYFRQFVDMNESKNIIAANSIPRPYLRAMGKDLTVIGLGMSKNSDEAVKKLNLLYYEKTLKQSIPVLLESNDKVSLGNSLPLLFDVRNTYIDQGLTNKKVEIEKWILKIGAITGKSSQINALLK